MVRPFEKRTGAHLAPVLDTLRYIRHETGVWLEVTTLLIPGLNDSDEELHAMAQWMVTELGPEVPWHFSAFHPDYRMLDRPPTPPATLKRARSIAMDAGMRYVFTGNIRAPEGQATYGHPCGRPSSAMTAMRSPPGISTKAAAAGSAAPPAPACSGPSQATGATAARRCISRASSRCCRSQVTDSRGIRRTILSRPATNFLWSPACPWILPAAASLPP